MIKKQLLVAAEEEEETISVHVMTDPVSVDQQGAIIPLL